MDKVKLTGKNLSLDLIRDDGGVPSVIEELDEEEVEPLGLLDPEELIPILEDEISPKIDDLILSLE